VTNTDIKHNGIKLNKVYTDKITCTTIQKFIPVIQAEISALLVSHDPSEIILICWNTYYDQCL